jgi:hypothetical protein
MTRTCNNVDCGKQYNVEDETNDDGFCTFECWEHIHCKTPLVEEHTAFDVDLSTVLS